MNERRGGYDDGYRKCSCFWGREASSLVRKLEEIVQVFAGHSVLDVGCGEGKNAAYLALRGADVLAFDVSPLAIGNARGAWPDVAGVEWLCSDAMAFDFGIRRFDIVIAYGLYHCLQGKDEIQTLQLRLSRATKAGGYHVVCAFNSRQQDLRAHPGFRPCLCDHSFYLDLYRDWDLLSATDSDLTEVHPNNGIRHSHAMTRLLARKTNNHDLD